jgi:hypothetical protein
VEVVAQAQVRDGILQRTALHRHETAPVRSRGRRESLLESN